MSINIDEIVTNMDLYKKRCFDTVACEIVDFENQDDKRYIELPEFNESDIIKAYIDINECKDLKYIDFTNRNSRAIAYNYERGRVIINDEYIILCCVY